MIDAADFRGHTSKWRQGKDVEERGGKGE